MPVQAATRVNRSTGNGVTTVFPYTFKLISQSHIRVTVDGVVKTITTDYTVSGVGDAGGGNVTFVSAPANLSAVVLSGSAPYSRSTDYVRNGAFQEETVDNDFDLAVILMQQLDERQGRAIAIPIDDATGTDVELPVAADRASKYLAFDADGNPVVTSGTSSVIVVSTFAETLLDDANAAAMRATIGAFASAGGNLSGMIVEAEGAAVASAASCNIWETDGNTCHITGTTQIDDFATAPQAGAWKKVIFDDALILNQSANLNLNGGGADITTAAGDMAFVYADTTTQMDVFVVRKSGAPAVAHIDKIVQVVEATPYTTYSSSATAMPYDDTIPQNTEGAEWVTVTITPTSATNRLRIEAEIPSCTGSVAESLCSAIFQDSTADALSAAAETSVAGSSALQLRVVHEMAAGTTSATTFKLRAGAHSGTIYVNGTTSARRFGGVSAIRMRVTEIKV